MIRNLLIIAVIAPLAIFLFAHSLSAKPTPVPTLAKHAEQTAENLTTCENADVSIFFHDIFITTGSAEYIFEGLRRTSHCSNLEFEIIPLITEAANEDDTKLAERRAHELQEYMKVAGFEVPIKNKEIDQITDVGDTGRAALLRIKTAIDK